MSATKKQTKFWERLATENKWQEERLRRFRTASGTVSAMSNAKWQKVLETLSEVENSGKMYWKGVLDEDEFEMPLRGALIEERYVEGHHGIIGYSELEFVRIYTDDPSALLKTINRLGSFDAAVHEDHIVIFGYTRAEGGQSRSGL